MAIDTPATIAVLGAGPIGLEAALYGRYLGYDVDVYERGAVGEHVRRWGHVRMYTPFSANRSPLALAALRAQGANWQSPGDADFLTGAEYVDRFLLPLAQSDLLGDGLRERTEVVAVGRDGPCKTDLGKDEARGDWMFRLLLRAPNGEEIIALADIVVDTTGVSGQSCAIGQGGIRAIGESKLRAEIEYRVPDLLTQKARYLGRHTLVVGNSFWAAMTLVALASLSDESPETKITWLIDRGFDLDAPDSLTSPTRAFDVTAAAEQAEVVRRANALATSGHPGISFLPATMIHSLERLDDGRIRVELLGEHAGQFECDNIVGNVGYRPDYCFLGELQIACDPIDERLVFTPPSSLITTEPNFYVLGAKSYGRRDDFFIRDGLDQIRELFKIIGDRDTLDLYATMSKLQ